MSIMPPSFAIILRSSLSLCLTRLLTTSTNSSVGGKTFDPNLHNAVMHVDDETFGESEVVEVFAKGYARGDKVLRHSMVKVAN